MAGASAFSTLLKSLWAVLGFLLGCIAFGRRGCAACAVLALVHSARLIAGTARIVGAGIGVAAVRGSAAGATIGTGAVAAIPVTRTRTAARLRHRPANQAEGQDCCCENSYHLHVSYRRLIAN